MKSPPMQVSDHEARALVEAFICTNGAVTAVQPRGSRADHRARIDD